MCGPVNAPGMAACSGLLPSKFQRTVARRRPASISHRISRQLRSATASVAPFDHRARCLSIDPPRLADNGARLCDSPRMPGRAMPRSHASPRRASPVAANEPPPARHFHTNLNRAPATARILPSQILASAPTALCRYTSPATFERNLPFNVEGVPRPTEHLD